MKKSKMMAVKRGLIKVAKTDHNLLVLLNHLLLVSRIQMMMVKRSHPRRKTKMMKSLRISLRKLTSKDKNTNHSLKKISK